MMFPQKEPLTYADVDEAQALLVAADLAQWRVSLIRGHGPDRDHFTAERTAAGHRVEVAAHSGEDLVARCREAEARNPSQPVAVAADGLDSSSYI